MTQFLIRSVAVLQILCLVAREGVALMCSTAAFPPPPSTVTAFISVHAIVQPEEFAEKIFVATPKAYRIRNQTTRLVTPSQTQIEFLRDLLFLEDSVRHAPSIIRDLTADLPDFDSPLLERLNALEKISNRFYSLNETAPALLRIQKRLDAHGYIFRDTLPHKLLLTIYPFLLRKKENGDEGFQHLNASPKSVVRAVFQVCLLELLAMVAIRMQDAGLRYEDENLARIETLFNALQSEPFDYRWAGQCASLFGLVISEISTNDKTRLAQQRQRLRLFEKRREPNTYLIAALNDLARHLHGVFMGLPMEEFVQETERVWNVRLINSMDYAALFSMHGALTVERQKHGRWNPVVAALANVVAADPRGILYPDSLTRLTHEAVEGLITQNEHLKYQRVYTFHADQQFPADFPSDMAAFKKELQHWQPQIARYLRPLSSELYDPVARCDVFPNWVMAGVIVASLLDPQASQGFTYEDLNSSESSPAKWKWLAVLDRLVPIIDSQRAYQYFDTYNPERGRLLRQVARSVLRSA